MVNFITKLLLAAGKNTILVVCNRLSKMIYFVVITDRGSQFVVKLTKKLNKMLEIETRLSTVFYP